MIKTGIKYFILVFLVTACGSSPRFTSNNSSLNEQNIKKTANIQSDSLNVPETEYLKIQVGIASYYAHEFHRKMTANGEIYNMYGLSAAHPTLPLNSIIRVTNLKNKKEIVIKINDRMPQHPERIIDLSYGAAKELDMLETGLQMVKVEVVVMGDNKRVD